MILSGKLINQFTNYIPSIGILIFVGLYIFSASHYPGGSQANLNKEGFDWINNYWCNLLNEKGMNGAPNPARPIAIFALLVLCFSLTVFFIQFAQTYTKSILWKRIISACGVLSMISAALVFTEYHDSMTIISSVFGLMVVAGIIKEIFSSSLNAYKISGAVCIIFLIGNNYIYYSQNFIELLPLLQKITFAFVLLWVMGLNHEMNKKINF